MDSSLVMKYFRRGLARGFYYELLQYLSYGIILSAEYSLRQRLIVFGLHLIYMIL